MRENSIRLGLMPPLTGVVEMYGAEITRAGQIACDEVNESGGVLGRPLELVIEDDGSLPESAVAAAARLVDHHRCAAIIGNLLSNSRIAVAYQVAEPRRIPYLNFSFYEGSILSHYFFHFAALPNQQIERMIPYMRERYGPRMFFAGNNYEWPRGSIDAAKRALEQSGGLTVGEEYYPIGVDDGDIERLLDQVAESGADVFVPYFAGADQTHLLTRFTERGLKQRMAVVMGHYDEIMASRLPLEVREGFYSSNTYFMTLDTPENKTYLARLASQPGVDGIWPQGNGILTNFGEGAYLCVKAFAKAANQAGSLDAEALAKALETISVSGPQGAVQMDPVSHHAQVNTCLSRCQADGSFTIIERFGAIPPVLPERYRHLRISKQTGQEDIFLESRMMAQITEAVLLVHATDGAIVYANPGAERMFGYKSDELSGKRFSVLFAPSGKSPEEATAAIGKVLFRKGVWQGETENITRDGKRFWCVASVSVFTHPEFGEVWMILNRDITERKQAEEQLRASEALLRRTQSMAAIGSWRLNVPQNELVWSAETYRIFGIPASMPLTYESFLANVHSDDRERVNSAWQAALKGAPYLTQHRIVVHGETRWVEERVELDFDAQGSLRSGTGSVQDITEHKRAEEALRQSEARFRRLVKVAPIPLCYVAKGGVIQDFNDRFAQVFGYTREDIPTLGEWWQLAYPDADYRRWVQATWDTAVQAAAESGQDIQPVEYNVTSKNGDVRTMEISGVTLGEDFLATFVDLTSRKQAEEKLRIASLYARSLIEASLDPLVTISAEGKITDVNKATEEATGFLRSELIGTDFADYFTEPDKALEGYRQVFTEGSVTDYPLAIRHQNGSITEVLYNASLYYDEAGGVLGVFAAARDITERKKAEESIRVSEARFSTIFNQAPLGIALIDSFTGRIHEVNPRFAEIAGRTIEEMMDIDWMSITHPDDVQEDLDNMALLNAGKIAGFNMEKRYIHPDGSLVWINMTIAPLRLEQGVSPRHLCMIGDITERKNAEIALKNALVQARRFAGALDNIPSLIYMKDLNRQYIYANKVTLKLFNCSAEELAGNGDAKFFPPETVAKLKAVDERVLERGEATMEEIDVSPGSPERRVYLEVKYPIYDDAGKIFGLCGISTDITEHKQLEEKIRQLNSELEQRVTARTAELEDANQELEAFSYSVSHDLRTPLRAIDGFSLILLEDYQNKLDDEGKRLLNVVRNNTSRMSRLIDDILRFSRAGRIEISFTEIDMEAMARSVIEELKPQVAGRKLQINLGSLPSARGDRAMLHQVFENLLSNAIKFTGKNEEAHIDIGGMIEAGKAVYHVKDNGAGFDMQYAGKLFGVFQRLHGVDEFEGTGIGLAIVKRIVARHGGTVWAEGEVGKGATFYFSIPVNPEKSA